VLDVGCGCGATTLAAARVVTEGHAHGVDLSVPMLERARANTQSTGITNATFEAADAQVHPFEDDAFDVVVSRFGIMFFADAAAAFANLRRATRPGGRLAVVCWQPLPANEWMTVPAVALAPFGSFPAPGGTGAPGMFAFADRDYTNDVLQRAGWSEISITGREAPILVGGPGTVETAIDFLSHGMMVRTILSEADADTKTRALDAVRTALTPYLDGEGVRVGAAVWLVTASSPLASGN
jgi:SAM-dependent methyltransferase